MPTKLSDRELSELKKLKDALELFRIVRTTMPLQYANTLLLVAIEEGKSVGDYAREAGISPSVMSRHLLDIGERNRHMSKGFGLVTFRPNPMNLREHQYFLTTKGQTLVNQLIKKMNG